MNKLNDVRGGSRVNFMRRAVSVVRFIQAVRYNNPDQKGIQPHISGNTCLINDGVSALLIDFVSPLIWVMLFIMCLIIN